MATFTPSGAQAQSISTIKAGVYPCEIVGAVAKISKDGHFEQHSLRVRVFDELHDNWEDFWELLTFSAKAQWKLEEVMKALGMRFTIGVSVDVEAGDWMGRTGQIVLKEEKQDGKDRLRIGRWMAHEGAPFQTGLEGRTVSASSDGLPF